MSNGEVLSTYTFPADVASSMTAESFLNDIMVDTVLQVAYISDFYASAIVVYDHAKQVSKKFSDEATMADPAMTGGMVINGVSYPGGPFDAPGIDGIALPHTRDRVYWCTLHGLELHSVDAATLLQYVHGTATHEGVKATMKTHGEKPGMADGLAFDNKGTMYMGAISNSTLFSTSGNALYSWKADGSASSTNAQLVAQNDLDLHWVDTFAFDNDNSKLLFTPNRLDIFFNDNTKYWSDSFNTDANPNIQVVSVAIGAQSYLIGQTPADTSVAPTSVAPTSVPKSTTPTPTTAAPSGPDNTLLYAGGGGGLVVLVIVIWILMQPSDEPADGGDAEMAEAPAEEEEAPAEEE